MGDTGWSGLTVWGGLVQGRDARRRYPTQISSKWTRPPRAQRRVDAGAVWTCGSVCGWVSCDTGFGLTVWGGLVQGRDGTQREFQVSGPVPLVYSAVWIRALSGRAGACADGCRETRGGRAQVPFQPRIRLRAPAACATAAR